MNAAVFDDLGVESVWDYPRPPAAPEGRQLT
ncbi:hypothetical protein ABH931_001571 [Streptacidiphilus sp. MAP12-33]